MPNSIPDPLSSLLAFYGAALSTVLAARELLKDRRTIRLTCEMALAPSPLGDPLEFVSVNVVNTSHRPIQITFAGLTMSNWMQFTQLASQLGTNPLPKRLEEHDKVSVFFDLAEVEKALRKQPEANTKYTAAYVSDAEGRTYKSRVPRLLKDRHEAQ